MIVRVELSRMSGCIVMLDTVMIFSEYVFL